MSRSVLSKIEKKVLSHKPDSKAFDLAHYIGAKNRKDLHDREKSKLTYVGLTVPATRKIFRQGFGFSEDEFLIWSFVFQNSQIYEVKSLALMHLRELKAEELVQRWKIIRELVHHVDNWAHSDELSHIYSKLLEYDFQLVWPALKKWNSSKNLWLRRQSVVGMLNYARMRQRTPPVKDMLKQIENLLGDESFYVQRGVGWALREVYHVDPKAQVQFVKKNLSKISATAWAAAGEKYPLVLKKQMVLQRKQLRSRR